MDATFKLCRHPLTQLFTVNAFVEKDDHVKQVPIAFVLMSGRKKSLLQDSSSSSFIHNSKQPQGQQDNIRFWKGGVERDSTSPAKY